MDESYWNEKYRNADTGWDLGEVSTPIKTILDALQDKNITLLIPGAGNAYEASYAWNKGFKNVHVLDISAEAISRFKTRNPDFPVEQIHHGDFFSFRGSFDLIIEQTFFCALPPELRSSYVKKMYELLSPSGKLHGVMFNRNFESGPPFGGTKAEYERLFSTFFEKYKFSDCDKSIPPRLGAECWVEAYK